MPFCVWHFRHARRCGTLVTQFRLQFGLQFGAPIWGSNLGLQFGLFLTRLGALHTAESKEFQPAVVLLMVSGGLSKSENGQ